MDTNKTYKKIVFENKAVSNLTDPQMEQQVGGRYLSYETYQGTNCDTRNYCCTMYGDCQYETPANCPTFLTCITCDIYNLTFYCPTNHTCP